MSFKTLSQQFAQLYVPNKNRRSYGLYGSSPVLHHLDMLAAWNYMPLKKIPNTLLRPYQEDLLPPVLRARDEKEFHDRIIKHINRGCRNYKHPGMNEFFYIQSCLGHDLQPQPEKTPLKKKKSKQEEEETLPEQMHLTYLEKYKHRYDYLWPLYLDYVAAMELADHIVQQEKDMFFPHADRVQAPSFTISTTVRKMRTPKSSMSLRGAII